MVFCVKMSYKYSWICCFVVFFPPVFAMADVEEEERLLDSPSPSHENGIENGEVESPLISETTTYTGIVSADNGTVY